MSRLVAESLWMATVKSGLTVTDSRLSATVLTTYQRAFVSSQQNAHSLFTNQARVAYGDGLNRH